MNPNPLRPAAAARTRHALALACVPLLLGVLLSCAGAWWQWHNLDALSQSRFEHSAERVEAEVMRRLRQASSGLKGARGAMASNPRFNREAFHAFATSRDLPGEFAGVHSFGFIQPVQRSALDAFVAAERADGAPQFTVRSSGDAPLLYVVRFVEPADSNQAALGFDMGQESARRTAVQYAIDTGEPTMLAGITLAQEQRHAPGLLYLLPVYRQGSHASNVEQRRQDVLGLLFVPVVVQELLGDVYATSDKLVDFELFDGSEVQSDRLIFDADGSLDTAALAARSAGPLQGRSFSVTHTLEVGSRVLVLRLSSNAEFAASQDRSSIALIAIGGTLLSLMMASTIWLLAAGRQRARVLAQDMTAELDRMAQVVQHTANAVTIMDRDMRIQWVNRGFTQITGYTLEEALGHTPGDLLSSGKSQPSALETLMDGARRGVACRVELINRARDGHEYWTTVEVQPLLDAQGQPVGFMEIGSDISEQKQTQLRLEAAMRDARALLDTVETHAIVSTTDGQGCITAVNDAFCRISGYTREELLGQNHSIISSGQQGQAFWYSLWQSIAGGKPWRGEICNEAKDGTLYWVDSMIAPFVGEHGRIEKYVSISTDITMRRQSAERLRQSEATFAASFQDAATGMALLSPRGQWLMANAAMCDFLGWSQAELYEMTLIDVTHPDEWDTDREQMQRLLDGQIPVYQRAKRYQHSDGHLVWGLASVSVVRNEQEQAEFVIVQIADITARKRAEEALGRSNALMEESQAVARVGGWQLDLGSGAMYWTREIYRILETSPDDLHPTLEISLEVFTPEARSRLEAALQAASEEQQGFDMELQLHSLQGRLTEVRVTGSATLEGEQVVRLSGILQDITERKQYERSLKEARERAEQATQSKGQFLANMSHEIRTPMNAILGMLRLLHNTELNSRQRDYADKTENAAKSLLALINDILDFSKVEAGKMQLDPQPFRVNRLMRSLSVILASNLGTQGVEVLFDIDPNIPDVLLGDSMRLQQVLINLGGNAVKFTRQGQVVVSLKLRHLSASQAQVEFAVQDSGIGIAPEHQQHIFTGFSQAEASTTRKFGGTGLGLAISRRMVELMGGELHLTSVLGVGSTFSFVLPLALVQEVPPELHEEQPPHAELRRALVVDSNAVARTLLSGMVQSWGWPCEAVASGEAALALVEQRLQGTVFPFDVVYLDWHMEGMDGWTTAARIRQLCTARGTQQPVLVMVSGNSRETLEQRTLDEQNMLNGFLVKPVTASMLLEAALESAASQARIRQSRRNAPNQRRLNGMRILVVEDNLINQQVAEELLMAEGALVSLAANGQLGVDAIAAAQAAGSQFHAVLMDIQMPVLDGFAATQLVRQQLQLAKLPIVAMTANAMASDRDDCLAAGMNAHVGKPFDLKVLVQTLLEVSGYQAPPSGVGSSPAGPAETGASLPASNLLDMAGALSRMGDMHSLYLRAGREFLQRLPEQLQLLQDRAGDLAESALQAHTLKGTAALLGAMDLSAVASHLEKLCRNQASSAERAATLQRLVQLASASSQALAQALAPLELSDTAASDTNNATQAPDALTAAERPLLQAALRRLTPQLQAADLSALETFAQQREALQRLPATLLQPLEEALQELELEAALQACQEIEAWLVR